MMKTPLAIVNLHALVIIYGVRTYLHRVIPDPRVFEWLLIKRWTPIIFILSAYFIVVLIGPKLMQNRRAFTLTTVLKCYNLCQVCLSAYLFKEFLLAAIQSGYSWGCQEVDPKNTPEAMRMAAACWWFFFSKIIDVLDTLFFILRKKNSQITFLHVYHHGSMIFNWYLAARFAPGGQMFFQCMINSFVHSVMYTYYFLSACGPKVQKYLWWKKYLTQLQLIQFCMVIFQFIYAMSTTCGFPVEGNYYVIGYVFALSTLFLNFYFETYSRQARERKADRIDTQRRLSMSLESRRGSCADGKKQMAVVDRQPIFSKNCCVR